MLIFTKDSFKVENFPIKDTNHQSNRSIFQLSQRNDNDNNNNWLIKKSLYVQMSEGQMLNYEEILNHLDKYDELIEVREEGAEIKEYLDSLTEDQRQEFYPTVDEFLRKLQSEKKVKDQVSEVDDEIIDNETKDQLTNLTIKSREQNYERPGFEGRHLPKLIQMLERGTTDRLPKKFKRKLGKRQINPRANSKIRKYVATHGFQPSPMLNDDDV